MKVFLVGGAVRDQLLKLPINDRDWVIVGATQEDVQNLLDQGYQQVGADFPVFLHPETGEEYALARTERKIADGYHGFTVCVDSSITIEDDLIRRDITLNSMAMTPEGDLVDPYNGLKDLKNKVIRHTSDAFCEDPLRVLRIARFFAKLPDFKVHESTNELCNNMCKSGDLDHLSTERFWAELEKGLSTNRPDKFVAGLYDLGAASHTQFLSSVFSGDKNHDVQTAKLLQAFDRKDRMVYYVSLISDNEKLPKCKTEIQTLIKLKKLFYNVDHADAHSVFKFLKTAGAYREGNQFKMFLNLLAFLERCNKKQKLDHHSLELMYNSTTGITSKMFPDKTGKDLGMAIDQARTEAIADLISNF